MIKADEHRASNEHCAGTQQSNASPLEVNSKVPWYTEDSDADQLHSHQVTFVWARRDANARDVAKATCCQQIIMNYLLTHSIRAANFLSLIDHLVSVDHFEV